MMNMMRINKLFSLLLVLLLLPLASLSEAPEAEHPVVVLRTAQDGEIWLELFPETAPATVENFLKLVDSGFYNGLTFHRIIAGFMAQGGDPLGNGTGGSETNIPGEFSSNGFENPLAHKRGVISMARSSDPNSASSQFFIMHADASHLDGSYAAFGQVIAGMGAVDAMCLNTHVTDSNGTVSPEDQPVILEAVRGTREEAEAAAAREAENGRAGGVFDDPTTGVSFPVPEGWSLQGGVNGTWTFSDGSDTFRLTTIDFWRQLGKAGQDQYASSGYDRAAFISVGFRSAFASMIGLQADQLEEETVGDALWYTASQESAVYRFGAQNGTILIFEAAPGASADAVEAILPLLTVE